MTYKLVLAFALIIIPSLAFFGLFSSYTTFDDEGYSIAVIRGVAEGVPLYTQQFDFHGPLPFLAKALFFRSLHIPITQETMRFWVFSVWMLSCFCLSLAVWRLTRNAILSAGAIVVTGTHLFALRFNPGHPEDFVVLSLSLAILVASLDKHWLTDRLQVAILAGIGSVLTFTKINVGLFYLFGLALWILASIPRSRAWRATAVLFTVVATAIPTALMRSFLWQSWQLLIVSTFSILITCSAFFRFPIAPRFGWKDYWIAGGSLAATLAAFLALTQASGSRLHDVFYQTVVLAATHTGMIVRSVFSSRAAVAIPVFVLAGLIQFKTIRAGTPLRTQPAAATLKIALSLMSLLLASVLHFQFYMPLAGAVCWLIAFPANPATQEGRHQSARIFIASIAVFQMLQVFPIRGAQTSWSTMALCICALLLLYDGLSEISTCPPLVKQFAPVAVKLVAGVTFALLTILTTTIAGAYFHTPSIGFPGSELVRVPMDMKANFDWVSGNVGHYCDALVTQPGLDSFLLWSSKPGSELLRNSPRLLVDWPITMPVDRQLQAASRLKEAARICAVYSRRLSNWWTQRLPLEAQGRVAELPLVSYIQQLSPIRKVGDYEIRGNAAVSREWTDDYLLNGIREMEGSHGAVGVPMSLLNDGLHSRLTFRFQMQASGPLVSVQARPLSKDDRPITSNPLLYVSGSHALMIRTGEGVYHGTQAGVADGQWHELELGRSSGRWAVSVDGQWQGFLDDFVKANKRPRYLEIGSSYVEKCPELGQGWRSFHGKLQDVRVRHEETPFVLEARVAP